MQHGQGGSDGGSDGGGMGGHDDFRHVKQETGSGGSLSKKNAAVKIPLARGSACAICRKRKLRCDGTRPICGTCNRLGHECVYNDPQHEKLLEKNRNLEQQIQLLEEELAAYRNGTSRASASPSTITQPGSISPHRPAPQSISTLEHESDFSVSAPIASSSSGATSLPSFAHDISGLSPGEAYGVGPNSAGLQNIHHQYNFATNVTPQYADYPPSTFQANTRRTDYPQTSLPPHSHAPSAPEFSERFVNLSSPEWGPRLTLHDSQPQELIHIWGGELPSIDMIVQLANIYFSTVHLHLPFLHRPRFLYSLHHPSSVLSAPSLCLTFAVLAVAAPYHDDSNVRHRANWWYQRARAKADEVISSGTNELNIGSPKTNLTVEIVQALCVLEMIEMGRTEHQRAFMTIGHAVRIASMLGLHRMDEDRIARRLGQTSDRRLRPPAVHPLPTDPVLLEECRRTMCAVFVLDRFESGCTGWPYSISEPDLRLLLPCAEDLYESGRCDTSDNPLFWPILPTTLENEQDQPGASEIGSFAWLARALLMGGRIQSETYRPSGVLADGPFRTWDLQAPLESVEKILAIDKDLDSVRTKLNVLATTPPSGKGINSPIIMILILLNCLHLNLHHLRVAHGLLLLPYNPMLPTNPGSAEYSMARCLEGAYALHETMSQLVAYENTRTTLFGSRLTVFTSFNPYTLYCLAFPAKFLAGEWEVISEDRSRSEVFKGGLVRGETAPQVPSGDNVFGDHMIDTRLIMMQTLIESISRIGVVWETGQRFSAMIRSDRARLSARAAARFNPSPYNSAASSSIHAYSTPSGR